MKHLFRFEWNRAVRTPGFIISLCIGNTITVLHWIMVVLPAAARQNIYLTKDIPMEYPESVFTGWIGEGSSQYSYLYFLILPLLAALPYADSLFQDFKNNFINVICTKTDRKKFLICRYLAVFLSGGIVSIAPLITNLLLTMTVLPCVKPEITSYLSMTVPHTSFVGLYMHSIWLFIFISLFIIFVHGGVIAGFSLVTAYYLNHRLPVLFAPFILELFLSSLFELLDMGDWRYMYFLHPGYPHPRLLPVVCLTLAVFIITLIEYFVKGKKEDIC